MWLFARAKGLQWVVSQSDDPGVKLDRSISTIMIIRSTLTRGLKGGAHLPEAPLEWHFYDMHR